MLVNNQETLQECLSDLEWLAPGQPVGLDLETLGCNPKVESPVGRAQPFLMSLCWREGNDLRTWVVCQEYIPEFKFWLEDEAARKVGHNLLHFDAHALQHIGIALAGVEADTAVMSRLLNPDKNFGHGLKAWGKRLGYDTVAYQDVTSRPTHSPKPITYTKTRTVVHRHCFVCGLRVTVRKGRWVCTECETIGLDAAALMRRVHYTEGAQTWRVSWVKKEQVPLDELWRDYPQRREALVRYAAQDAILHLLVFEHLQEKLEGLPW